MELKKFKLGFLGFTKQQFADAIVLYTTTLIITLGMLYLLFPSLVTGLTEVRTVNKNVSVVNEKIDTLNSNQNYLHEKLDVDAVIVMGCVIKGETMHFEFVCEGVTQGMKDLNLLYDVPTIFCVLTDNTLQQSIDRSGGKHGNKGIEAAVAALKMIELNSKLSN